MTIKKSFIFDVDGTLTDTEKVTVNALRKTMKQLYSKEYTFDQLRFTFMHTGEGALRELGVQDIDGTFEIWGKNIIDMYDRVVLYPGIEQMLKILKKNSKKLGIVTSRDRYEVDIDYVLERIFCYFDVVVPHRAGLRPKPYPDQLLEVLNRLDTRPEEAFYIGDSRFDYECAKSSCVDFILANWGESDRRGNIPSEDIIVCNRPEELYKFI